MPNLFRLTWFLANSMNRLYWDHSSMTRYQEKKLRSVINYAYHNVAFYHDLLKKHDVDPSEIKTLKDLNKIPIVKKEQLKAETPERLVSREYDYTQLKKGRTSGSTGKPLIFYMTGQEDEWRKAIYMRANISCGQRPRDSWVFIAAPHHYGDTTGIQRKLGIFAMKVVSVFEDVDYQIKYATKERPDILDGYSQALLLLAKEVKYRDIQDIQPKIVFGSADLIDDKSQKYIEDVFNAPYLDQFGCSEIDRSAWHCPEKIGYHMDVDSVITQFVDEDGIEVAPGEKGEVIYTSLFNYAMPFIRYAVGDFGTLLDDECTCDRTLPLMNVVGGRTDSFIISPSSRVITPYEFIVVMFDFPYFQEIAQYRIIQNKIDSLEIQIRKMDENFDETLLASEVVKHLYTNMALDDLHIEVKFKDDIKEESGKLNTIISKIKR